MVKKKKYSRVDSYIYVFIVGFLLQYVLKDILFTGYLLWILVTLTMALRFLLEDNRDMFMLILRIYFYGTIIITILILAWISLIEPSFILLRCVCG